jgi:hypothetical protein
MLLLNREFSRRLAFPPQPAAEAQPALART